MYPVSTSYAAKMSNTDSTSHWYIEWHVVKHNHTVNKHAI